MEGDCRLREYREKAGFSQVELSANSGVGLTTIYRIENGKFDNATVGVIKRLAKALHCKPGDFFGKSA
jgi:transcriptional regulator with XRE-family HTH domain